MAKAKQVYSWGDIPQEKFEAFYKAVEKLREEMIPRDCDGDHPIDMVIVNRMTHEPINYLAVPRSEVYSYVTHGFIKAHPDKQQEMEDATESALTANLHMATEALDRHMRLKIMHHQNERRDRRPFNVRINEACKFCKQKIGFDPDNKGDFFVKTRAEWPGFPLVFHTNGQRCEAHKIRVAEFRIEYPQFDPDPEPLWCVNPECRCQLPGYNSKKGANDKYICVNPACGKDNSKHYPEAAK